MLREEADLLDSTVVQLLVLRMLYKKPNIGLNELAEALQLGNSTMSVVVERLVLSGMVVRDRSTTDRRSLTMRLTLEGEKKREEAFGDHSVLTKRLLHMLDMPEKDLQHLFRVHDQLLEKLEIKGDETQ